MADFNKYYAMQSQGLPGFHGPSYQKGHGLGSMFKRLFRWVIPTIKQNAAPLLTNAMEGIKSSVSDGVGNFQKDLEDDKKSIKESAKQRIMETFKGIKRHLDPQSGSGSCKRKKRLSRKAVSPSIFDE